MTIINKIKQLIDNEIFPLMEELNIDNKISINGKSILLDIFTTIQSEIEKENSSLQVSSLHQYYSLNVKTANAIYFIKLNHGQWEFCKEISTNTTQFYCGMQTVMSHSIYTYFRYKIPNAVSFGYTKQPEGFNLEHSFCRSN